MTEDFKKWLCEKAGYKFDTMDKYYQKEFLKSLPNGLHLEILIKAVWAINRERKWNIFESYFSYNVYKDCVKQRQFHFKDYNNSEQKTLEKALEYIYEQELSE